MNKKQIEEQGYVITHHLRDIDRYVLPYGPGKTKVNIYGLLRDNQRHATVVALAGEHNWTPTTQKHIKNLMLEHCPPVVKFGKYEIEPRVAINSTKASTSHVIPSHTEKLCQELYRYLNTVNHNG